MKLNKKSLIDSLIIGAALFSMFFGAGNMIFPPFLGFESGNEWLSGFFGYYIADIGLAILAIIAQINRGSFDDVLSPLGRTASTALMLSIILCLGPFISIPRTCATTFELAILPNLPTASVFLFSVIFFGITLSLSFNETKVVDIVGKVLTPVLIIGLLFLIIKGIIDPISSVIDTKKTLSPVGAGIEAGYQSMDVLGAAVFGVLAIGGAIQRGNKDRRSVRDVTLGASLVAGLGLFVIYLGLTYLGATVSTLFNMHTSRAELLLSIVELLLPQKFGLIFFGIIAGLACMTTSVALTSSASKYLQKLFRDKLSYKTWVIIICVFSAVASSLGVEGLVALASPVLTVVYPPILAMVIMSFFHKWLTPLAYRLAAGGAFLYGVADAIAGFGIRLDLISYLPFFDMGMGWILPTLVLALIGNIKKFSKNS